MTKQNLEKDIKEATIKLLEMAREHAWNKISDECLYITSEIQDATASNFFDLRKIRKRENEKKEPKPLAQVVEKLNHIYEDLYDVNLYIYKSMPEWTIVEIQYYPKSSLEKAYLEKVKNNDPMLHCKEVIPPYSKGNHSKFDINWELD